LVCRRLLDTFRLPMTGWETVTLELPKLDELKEVWEKFPALRPICQRQDLQAVVCKPKVLDLLATQIVRGRVPDAKNWLGESDLIAWFWESEIRKAPHEPTRSRFAELLAEKQGDLVSHDVPTSEFNMAELAALEGLKEDRICVERASGMCQAV